MRVRVIGVGSAFGDDAVGLAVAELLARRPLPAQITVARCERPMPDLLDALDEVEGIVLVDATRSGAPIGSVRHLRAEEVTRAKATSSHGFGVASALLLAQTLGRSGRSGGVGRDRGGSTSLGRPLSAAVEGALPEAVALALNLAAKSRAWTHGADAMHEAKLCLSLLALAEQHLASAGGGRIVGVRLEVGDFAGVAPEALAAAFPDLRGRHGRGGRDAADR